MSDGATVEIVDVEPRAVKVTGKELRSGDVVFDVWGKQYKLMVVARRPKSRTVRFTRDDWEWDVIGFDETITIIPGVRHCTSETGHLPGSDHRWQECPTYHDGEES